MIFTVTMLTVLASAMAKVLGFLIVPWPIIVSLIFVIPLLYVALGVLIVSAQELIQYEEVESGKDGENDN